MQKKTIRSNRTLASRGVMERSAVFDGPAIKIESSHDGMKRWCRPTLVGTCTRELDLGTPSTCVSRRRLTVLFSCVRCKSLIMSFSLFFNTRICGTCFVGFGFLFVNGVFFGFDCPCEPIVAVGFLSIVRWETELAGRARKRMVNKKNVACVTDSKRTGRPNRDQSQNKTCSALFLLPPSQRSAAGSRKWMRFKEVRWVRRGGCWFGSPETLFHGSGRSTIAISIRIECRRQMVRRHLERRQTGSLSFTVTPSERLRRRETKSIKAD